LSIATDGLMLWKRSAPELPSVVRQKSCDVLLEDFSGQFGVDGLRYRCPVAVLLSSLGLSHATCAQSLVTS